MKKSLFVLFILISGICYSQNDKPERNAYRLEVAIDAKNYYGMDVQKSLYFPKEKLLQIYAGESLNIETEIKADTIYCMKIVKEIIYPEKTILLKLDLSTKENVDKPIMLTVTNPFGKTLNYNAAMFIANHNDWIETSIIPILAGVTNFEMWNDKIISLVLYNWRLEEE